MREKESWHPTKFVMVDGQLRSDRSGAFVSVSSRLITDLVAQNYEAAIKRYARGRLLDLGCGSAPLYEVYRDLVDEVVCIDWPTSLHQQEHVDLFADLSKPFPLKSSYFNTVVFTDVLEHIPNPELPISEISRILKPGGCTVIGVPFLYGLHEVPHDYNRYTRYQLERLMANAGLNVVELAEIGGGPEVLFDLVGKLCAHRPRIAATLVFIARWCLSLSVVARVSERTKRAFPLSYIVVAIKPSCVAS
jgi:SAM-dependent methyltransferase